MGALPVYVNGDVPVVRRPSALTPVLLWQGEGLQLELGAIGGVELFELPLVLASNCDSISQRCCNDTEPRKHNNTTAYFSLPQHRRQQALSLSRWRPPAISR